MDIGLPKHFLDVQPGVLGCLRLPLPLVYRNKGEKNVNVGLQEHRIEEHLGFA